MYDARAHNLQFWAENIRWVEDSAKRLLGMDFAYAVDELQELLLDAFDAGVAANDVHCRGCPC